MAIFLKILHLFDNKKKRDYVSEVGNFLAEYDRKFPMQSKSQDKEAQKHRNIFNRKTSPFVL